MATDLARLLSQQDLSELTVMGMPVDMARATFAQYRGAQGFKPVATTLLSPPGSNMKLDKNETQTWSLALAQANVSERWNTCRWSTPICRDGCVAKAGNGGFGSTVRARIAKTAFLAEAPQLFLRLLIDELDKVPAGSMVRLNTFSDLPWETLVVDAYGRSTASWLFDRYAGTLRFYDYTKGWERSTAHRMPANYRLTLSASEFTSDAQVTAACANGHRVAVVFSPSRVTPLPKYWNDLTVFDGDKTDDRWSTPRGTVVGLRAKGTMRTNGGAMVRQLETWCNHDAPAVVNGICECGVKVGAR